MISWDLEKREFLKKIITEVSYAEATTLMAEKFEGDFTTRKLKAAAERFKFRTGRTGQFKKGNIPFNKGKKGLIGANITSFKSGKKPTNWVKVGTERVTRDGYIEVKYRDVYQGKKNWRGKHILLWEKVNGAVPEGCVIIFGDRNKRNFNIDNLLLVTRGQLATLNKKGLIQEDTELTKTGILIADLSATLHARKVENE